jgi:hypothetical protein
MYLFQISNTSNKRTRGKYDSAIVIASCEDEARKIHPCNTIPVPEWEGDTWCEPEEVHVRMIGTACSAFTAPCVLLASYEE